MVLIRLSLVIYSLSVAHKAACQTLSKAFLKSTKTWYRFFLVLQVFLTELLSCAPSCSETCLFVFDDLLGLCLQSIQDSLQDPIWMTDQADGTVVWHSCRLPFFWTAMIRGDRVQGVGHSPFRQILLQMMSNISIMASPAWTSSGGMLSTPADLPFISDFTAASTSSRRKGYLSLLVSGETSSTWDLLLMCVYTIRSSTLSTSLEYLDLL